MKSSKLFLSIFSLLLTNALFAQSFIGQTIDNYAGVYALTTNPANIVNSGMKTDINLFSASAIAGSDYFGISMNNLTNTEDGFDFDEGVDKDPQDDNNFFLNADIMGPSFMFKLNEKSSIGLITRARAFFNLHNINGLLYEDVTNGFDTDSDFSFSNMNMTGTMHVWAEIGLVYGRMLVDNDQTRVKAGATLKYLQGAGGLFVTSNNLGGQYIADQETLTTTGNFTYGTTDAFDNDDINLDHLTSGFGFDLGVVFELGSDMDALSHQNYKLKLGISINDLGSIDYENSSVTNYDVDNKTIDANDFENQDVEDVLDQNYPAIETIENTKITLPTSVKIFADYKLKSKWFISALGTISAVSKDDIMTNTVLNMAVVTPRYESKWFSFYMPVGVREYDGFSWGAGFRLGPLTVGSSSVFTNLMSESTKTADVYVGLKVPIYRKSI